MRKRTAEELRSELRQLEAEERERVWAARTCRVCGERDEHYGGMKGYLTEFRLAISPGEEGHSVIESYLCDEDLPMVTEALAECGIVLHAHGGICFLEDRTCPGVANPELCPTPEPQYPE